MYRASDVVYSRPSIEFNSLMLTESSVITQADKMRRSHERYGAVSYLRHLCSHHACQDGGPECNCWQLAVWFAATAGRSMSMCACCIAVESCRGNVSHITKTMERASLKWLTKTKKID